MTMDEIRLGDAQWIHDGPPPNGPDGPDAPVVGLCVICWFLHLDTRDVAVQRVAEFIVGGRGVCRDHLMIATAHDAGLPALLADAGRLPQRYGTDHA
jgi:hypothetical protein